MVIMTLAVTKPALGLVLWCMSIYKIWMFYRIPKEQRVGCSVSGWIALFGMTSLVVVSFLLFLSLGVHLVHHHRD